MSAKGRGKARKRTRRVQEVAKDSVATAALEALVDGAMRLPIRIGDHLAYTAKAGAGVFKGEGGGFGGGGADGGWELPSISLPQLPEISLPDLPDVSLPDIGLDF